MSDLAPHEVIHWAGQWFRAGSQLRQRCGWCGAVLVDVDLANVARPVEDLADIDPNDPTAGYPTWPTAGLVAHDGHAWWLVDDPGPDDPMPPGSCTKLPLEATL